MSNINKIDLNLLIVLDALLDERSVTRAAARLGYTQPTISGMLARLRDLFGDPLFVRAQRGLLATPRAQALAVPLKQLLADSQHLVTRDAFDPANAEATFTVSSNDYMQQALLVPFVKVLRSEARQVRLAIVPPIIEGLGSTWRSPFQSLRCPIFRHGYSTANTMSSPFARSIRSRGEQP